MNITVVAREVCLVRRFVGSFLEGSYLKVITLLKTESSLSSPIMCGGCGTYIDRATRKECHC